MVEGGVTVNWIRMVLDGFMMAAYEDVVWMNNIKSMGMQKVSLEK